MAAESRRSICDVADSHQHWGLGKRCESRNSDGVLARIHSRSVPGWGRVDIEPWLVQSMHGGLEALEIIARDLLG